MFTGCYRNIQWPVNGLPKNVFQEACIEFVLFLVTVSFIPLIPILVFLVKTQTV